MSEIRVDKLKNEAGSGAVELTEGASIPTGKNLTGAGGINITGDIVTTGTITYEDVTNIDSLGIVTARGGLEVGTSGAGGTITSAGDAVFAGLTTARFGGVTETVSVGSTSHYIQDKSVTLELDCSKGSVFTHDLSSGNVGIVSIKNFRVNTNTFTTATVIFTQNSSTPSAGAGNTMTVPPATQVPGGIGTEVTLTPLGVTGFSTNGLVGSATTVVLSGTARDIDVVTFGIHYNGGGTGTAGNYRTLVNKSGDFRFGDIGF